MAFLPTYTVAGGQNIPFARQMDDFIDKVGGDASTVIRKAALDLLRGIVERTPVDTGRLRGNWLVSIDQPNGNERDTNDPSGATATRHAVMALEPFDVKKNTTIFIQNNLDYAPVVEYGLYPAAPKKPSGKTVGGYSTQAPEGMVRITLREFDAFLEKACAEVNK